MFCSACRHGYASITHKRYDALYGAWDRAFEIMKAYNELVYPSEFCLAASVYNNNKMF